MYKTSSNTITITDNDNGSDSDDTADTTTAGTNLFSPRIRTHRPPKLAPHLLGHHRLIDGTGSPSWNRPSRQVNSSRPHTTYYAHMGDVVGFWTGEENQEETPSSTFTKTEQE
ncbi:hypothetical protein MKZ38_007219 [Zalerion maritima]|uniref:Uncharacterized protein n=1 Tax=Zalerion maritima TaxID=339359 RepID=A0AAD5RJ76_9PEZI|nr:hypothetical protein MKZ38_007219 [Zalerion maritima]